MARTVSAEFKAIWQRKRGKGYNVRVGYKRRYWNGAAFAWESSFTYLNERDFVGVGAVPWTLDSQLQNVVRAAVVTLTFKNTRNEWIQSTVPPSFFAADDTATDGYRLLRSEFIVQIGYVLSDGSTEWVTVFDGYAMTLKIGSDGKASVRCMSKSAYRLEKSDPTGVSTAVTLEDCIPATGDGANKSFESTSVGVDHLTDVQVNAASLVEGTDFDAENFLAIAKPGNTGKVAITMQAAPGVGETVKVSLLKWLAAQSIETILGLVADEAGITAGERTIDPIVLPNAAGYKQIDSEAEWAASDSETNFSSAATPGSGQRKWFLFDDLSSSEGWNLSDNGGTAEITGGVLKLTGPALATKSFDKAVGTWECRVTGSTIGSWIDWYWDFIVTEFAGLYSTNNGYRLLAVPDPPVNNLFRLHRVENGSIGSVICEVVLNDDAGKLRVTRDASGNFELRWIPDFDPGGTYADTGNDTQFSSSVGMAFKGVTDAAQYATFDNLYWSPEVDPTGAVDVSATVAEYIFDLAVTPSAMGILERYQTLNSGTVAYTTAGAADSGGSPGAWDALVAISANGQMNHTAKQWLKIHLEITPATGSFTGPTISRLKANFSTSTIVLALASLRSLSNCQAAFAQLAKLVDYETGDYPDGSLFFRSKTVATDPVVDLSQENGIRDVTDWNDGRDAIVNVGVVRFGNYLEIYDGASASEASPTSEEEYGRILPPGGEVNLGSMLLANDVNIAAARAQLYYERNYLPKRRIRFTAWVVPWLDIGDKVTVTVIDQTILTRAVANDPCSRVGPFASFGTPENILANALPMKVLEYKPNWDTGIAEIYAEEIL